MLLTDTTRHDDALRLFSTERLWELFDGDRKRLNIAHECIDRHAVADRVALRVAHAEGHDEVLSFRQIASASSRCLMTSWTKSATTNPTRSLR